jgi:hypothetical protein
MRVIALVGKEEREIRHIHLLKIFPTAGCEFRIKDSTLSGINVRIDGDLEIRPVSSNAAELDFAR